MHGYSDAIGSAKGSVLIVCVVNGSVEASAATHEYNAELIRALLKSSTRQRSIAQGAGFLLRASNGQGVDVVLVDRASVGRRLPSKQGVGLARKIGCDLALELYRSGRIREPWLYCTDADATLPAGYFSAIAGRIGAHTAAAALFPFEHRPAADRKLTGLTQLYELSLRYYVLGLAWAGSPYAFHTIGSTLAIQAESYAKVRGFPRRQGGEDFYALNKLAKLAPVWRLDIDPIQIETRRSDRVAFGTGPGVARLEQRHGQLCLYHPNCFLGLRAWLEALQRFAQTRDQADFFSTLANAPAPVLPACKWFGERQRVSTVLRQAAQHTSDEHSLIRRLHTWFDAMRTLQLIHAVRDHGNRRLPYLDALDLAPFTSKLELGASPARLLRSLGELESSMQPSIGPTCLAR